MYSLFSIDSISYLVLLKLYLGKDLVNWDWPQKASQTGFFFTELTKSNTNCRDKVSRQLNMISTEEDTEVCNEVQVNILFFPWDSENKYWPVSICSSKVLSRLLLAWGDGSADQQTSRWRRAGPLRGCSVAEKSKSSKSQKHNKNLFWAWNTNQACTTLQWNRRTGSRWTVDQREEINES